MSIYFSAVERFLYTRALLPTRIETTFKEQKQTRLGLLALVEPGVDRLKIKVESKRYIGSNWVSNNKIKKLIILTDFYTYNRTKKL